MSTQALISQLQTIVGKKYALTESDRVALATLSAVRRAAAQDAG